MREYLSQAIVKQTTTAQEEDGKSQFMNCKFTLKEGEKEEKTLQKNVAMV